jgi:hypothetical protein
LELDHAYLVREDDSQPVVMKLGTFKLPTGTASSNEVSASELTSPTP